VANSKVRVRGGNERSSGEKGVKRGKLFCPRDSGNEAEKFEETCRNTRRAISQSQTRRRKGKIMAKPRPQKTTRRTKRRRKIRAPYLKWAEPQGHVLLRGSRNETDNKDQVEAATCGKGLKTTTERR